LRLGPREVDPGHRASRSFASSAKLVSRGVTLGELGRIMKNAGAYDAISRDAGGSSTMYVKGRAW
jgi:exopolysaccharide biosynthesis protein